MRNEDSRTVNYNRVGLMRGAESGEIRKAGQGEAAAKENGSVVARDGGGRKGHYKRLHEHVGGYGTVLHHAFVET